LGLARRSYPRDIATAMAAELLTVIDAEPEPKVKTSN
jgi:hypothetical protein